MKLLDMDEADLKARLEEWGVIKAPQAVIHTPFGPMDAVTGKLIGQPDPVAVEVAIPENDSAMGPGGEYRWVTPMMVANMPPEKRAQYVSGSFTLQEFGDLCREKPDRRYYAPSFIVKG